VNRVGYDQRNGQTAIHRKGKHDSDAMARLEEVWN
jgi:hypothetical protein